jgi:hypothetical protein
VRSALLALCATGTLALSCAGATPEAEDAAVAARAAPTPVEPAPSPAAPRTTASTAPATASPAKPPPRQTPVPRPAEPGSSAPPDEPTFETSGTLTATEERVLKAVVVCVRAAADRGEPSSRPLDVELAVDASGHVSDVRLGAGYAKGAAECVKRSLLKLTYPARPGGGVEFVRYPIDGLEEEPASD